MYPVFGQKQGQAQLISLAVYWFLRASNSKSFLYQKANFEMKYSGFLQFHDHNKREKDFNGRDVSAMISDSMIT